MIFTTRHISLSVTREEPDYTEMCKAVQTATGIKHDSLNCVVLGDCGYVRVYFLETPLKVVKQYETKLTKLLKSKGYKVS
jgi:hypothetical protein